MKKLTFLALALLAAAFTIPSHAQEAKKDSAPKPPDSPAKVVIDSWNDIGRKLIAMAEDFPEDKYDFKPTPAQRSFAEQLLHAAGKATGLPVLLNTSFNLFGEPLVCTPRDAVRSFYSSGIDSVFIGNFFLQK